MKIPYAILSLSLCFLLASPKSLQGGITIGIEQTTIDGQSNYLNIFYTATSAYTVPPFNFWNSQLFTLRWSTTLGSEVIKSISNRAAFSFALDGVATDGGDGYYYQKFTSSSTTVIEAIAAGARTDVLAIEVGHSTIATGDFELMTTPNDWVATNFGRASVNAAVGDEQFMGFAPALVSGVVLPVELINLAATAQTKDILVSWTVEAEDLSHYIVERSTEGLSGTSPFLAIGSRQAQNLPRAVYTLIDADVSPGQWYYYRLKLVDTDGSYRYSPIRKARLEDGSDGELSAFPNPTTGDLQIQFTSLQPEAGFLILHDAMGREIRRISTPVEAGLNQFPFQLSLYPAGQYSLQLIATKGNSLGLVRCIKID